LFDDHFRDDRAAFPRIPICGIEIGRRSSSLLSTMSATRNDLGSVL